MGNKPQNNPQKKVTNIVLVDAFTYGDYDYPVKDVFKMVSN